MKHIWSYTLKDVTMFLLVGSELAGNNSFNICRGDKDIEKVMPVI